MFKQVFQMMTLKTKKDKNVYLQNRKRLTDRENKFMVTKGGRGLRNKLGVRDKCIHTTRI